MPYHANMSGTYEHCKAAIIYASEGINVPKKLEGPKFQKKYSNSGHGQGYGGRQKYTILILVGSATRFEAY